MWWCVLTRPGRMTCEGRLSTSSAFWYSSGSSELLPTHLISFPFTYTAASDISPSSLEKVARVPMSCKQHIDPV